MGSHDRNTPNVVSQVHTQLSFARGNDAYYDEILDDAGSINQHSFPVVGGPLKYIRLFLESASTKKNCDSSDSRVDFICYIFTSLAA